MTTHAFSSTGLSDAELKKAVGARYHCGLSDGTRYYGYMFEPVTQDKSGGFHWKTDTTTKEALTSYSSGQLIDRDLSFFPRITDGDFSGGGYQEVWIDPKRYFDSDLDPRTPGYLQLRSQWARVSKAGLTVGTSFECVTFKGDFWFTFGEANGHVYSANGGATTVPVAGAIISLMTDGTRLYAGTSTQLYRTLDGITWTPVTAAINGTADEWWVIEQGTNGFFAYYSNYVNSTLYKVDLTMGFPIAAVAQPQVPTGANSLAIIDLCEYQTSIAILSTDFQGNGNGFDVWYHDGTNLTRIVRVDGYSATGICNSLGSLYVGAYAMTKNTSPILAKIDSGTFEIVARPGSPFPLANQSCGQPQASSQYVYWPVFVPSISGISGAPGVILQYDVLTGALSHLPNMDTTDFTTVPALNIRTIAMLGDAVAGCYVNGTTGVLQYQTHAFGLLNYMAAGWLVSSHIDFATPGIQKRFRRIEVHHSPLNVGEVIQIQAYVDQDPLQFTTALAPVPATATATNNLVGTSLTALTFGADTIGKTLYFALKISETETPPNTTPRVAYISIEVGGTWVADINLACTSRRQNLGQEFDTQGATAADLAYLLYLAQENGSLLTFYHPNGQTYTMAIESLDGWNPSPLQTQVDRPQDEEYVVHAILRQLATPAVG